MKYNYDWYWKNGLHDAKITDIKTENLDYDYKQKNPIRNVLEIFLDSRGAMNDTTVKSLRFYNYKIISGDVDLINTWWYDDDISEIDGRIKLKIESECGKKEHKCLALLFDKAEIIR